MDHIGLTSTGSLYKGHRKKEGCSLPPCSYSHWEVHWFTDIKFCFFEILEYTEVQLRHPASGTEQLLN